MIATVSERDRIRAGDYDLCSPAIHCVADALGCAHIYEFEDVDGDPLLILARDSREASHIFRDYNENQDAGLPFL